MKNKKIITICASASFYKQVIEVQKQLQTLGFKVLVPITANKMKRNKDFNVAHYKTWFKTGDYKRKAYLTKKHFAEVTKGDIILVLNYSKNGRPDYIGGNVLCEMGLAFYLGKPIYILNPIDETSSFKEEILGFRPKIIRGNLGEIK